MSNHLFYWRFFDWRGSYSHAFAVYPVSLENMDTRLLYPWHDDFSSSFYILGGFAERRRSGELHDGLFLFARSVVSADLQLDALGSKGR
jgi:hypothetical protein